MMETAYYMETVDVDSSKSWHQSKMEESETFKNRVDTAVKYEQIDSLISLSQTAHNIDTGEMISYKNDIVKARSDIKSLIKKENHTFFRLYIAGTILIAFAFAIDNRNEFKANLKNKKNLLILLFLLAFITIVLSA